MRLMQAKIASRNVTPVQGDLRYTLTVGEGKDAKVYVAFVKPAQIQTLNLLGEKVPNVGQTVTIEPSEVQGKDGTNFCTISL